jgi:integrase
MAVKLPYVMAQKRRGGTDYYYRRNGALQKIEGDPGDRAAFFRAYQAAEAIVLGLAEQEDDSKTFRDLIAAYQQMPEFLDLSPRSKDDYRKQLARIGAAWGDWTVAACEDRRWKTDVYAWRDLLATASKRQADYAMQVLKRLVAVCYERNLISYDHVAGTKAVYKAERTDKRWSLEQVEAFMQEASEPLQWVMMLALHTGQRQQDLIALPWTAYDGQWIRLRQLKGRRGEERRGGALVEIPASSELRAVLDVIPRRAVTILTTIRGLPWCENNLSNRWKDVCRRIGVHDLHFHDLRGTTVTLLADCGATEPEIASITGHSLRSVHAILSSYLGRTKTQASNAVAKFSSSWVNGLKIISATPTATGSKEIEYNLKKCL